MLELKSFTIENTWLTRKNNNHGWGNGYVAVPVGHKYHGLDYDEIDEITINGGLTLSCKAEEFSGNKEVDDSYAGYWVLGFDTCHAYDSLERWSEEEVEKETLFLKLQLERIGGHQ